MKFLYKYIILLVLLLTIPYCVNAQNSIPCTVHELNISTSKKNFSHLTVNEGFARSSIMDILQAENGMMWFASWDGLYFFDGYHVKKACQPKSVAGSTVIKSILEAEDNEIWMETYSGLFIWDDRKQQIRSFASQIAPKDSIKGNYVFLTKDKSGLIWFGTSESRIYSYNTSTEELIEEYVSDVSEKSIFLSMYIDDKNNKWICTIKNGIFKLADSKDSKKKILTREKMFHDFESENVFCLFQDSRGRYWIATSDAFYCITVSSPLSAIKPNDNKNTGHVYQYKLPAGLPIDDFEAFNFEEYGKQIKAATTLGLFSYDAQTEEAKFIVSESNSRHGINDSHIRSVIYDREGGLWLGTFNGGVNYLSPTSENFSSYDYINNKLKGHVVSCIVEDEQRNLWIGTRNGGYAFWNRQTDNIQNFTSQDNHLLSPSGNNVQSILVKKDKIYLGMYKKGMDVIDLKNRSRKNYNAENTSPFQFSNSVYGFLQIDNNNLLVATIDGLFLFDESSQHFYRILETDTRIKTLIQDGNKDIWAGGKNGLYHYSGDLILKEHLHHCGNDTTLEFYDDIISLASSGTMLYIGTKDNGLWAYNSDERNFIRIAEHALGDAEICHIIIDKESLWTSTNKGLFLHYMNSGYTRYYSRQDGLCYKQFHGISGVQAYDHTIFFGTISGVVGFNPNKLISNKVLPQVLIIELCVFNKPVQPSDEDSPLPTSIGYADEIDLSQNENNFSFRFASSSYSQTESNFFEYKLEPFEKEWQRNNDGGNVAYYTNIPPGKYTLHVRTCNGKNAWSEEKTVRVNVHPYWWLSLPMKMLYIVSILCIIGFLLFNFVQKKKREMYLFRLEKEQEIYHSKMEFFTFLIHEIRTPLTLIIGPLSDIMRSKGNVENMSTQLNTISRNANRLLLQVNQLMDFRKVEENSYQIKKEKIDLKILVEQVVENFKYNFSKKNVNLSVHLPKEPCFTIADKEAVNKVVTNLLSNASKFTTDSIDVTLRLAHSAREWEISVQDNGKGISKTDQKKIFTSFYQVHEHLPSDYIGSGVGLRLVKRLLELQGGSVSVESQLGVGSCFIAKIPIAEGVCQKQCDDEQTGSILPASSTSAIRKYHLLVVEDNEDMRQYIKSVFEPYYIVDDCSNGEEALDLTEKKGYDLVITDLMMPVMDGITLSRKLKNSEKTSHIPIVILTAKEDETSRVEGYTAHADAYVVKPFSTRVLLSQVESIIRNRENVHQQYQKCPEVSDAVICQNDCDKQFFERLNTLIDEQITNASISIDDLAAAFCMCRTSFYQKIKGVAGVTPNEYINTYKLKKAAQLMKGGNYRINEICYLLGFSSSSYFAKKFMAQFGMSPSEYMNSQKKQG